MAPVASRGAGAGVGLARRKKASWGDTGLKDGRGGRATMLKGG